MNPLNFLAATVLYRISLVGCVSYVLRAHVDRICFGKSPRLECLHPVVPCAVLLSDVPSLLRPSCRHGLVGDFWPGVLIDREPWTRLQMSGLVSPGVELDNGGMGRFSSTKYHACVRFPTRVSTHVT